jgi:transcriptional regulator with XRE-family HTH domain
MAKGSGNLIREAIIFNVQRLSRATALAGLTRRQLGHRAGLSAQPIADAFGARPVSVRSSCRIAEALGMDLRRLVARALPCATAAATRRNREEVCSAGT